MTARNTSYLEFEMLTYITEFCKILDQSTDYFLLSRFASAPARRAFFQHLYEENLPKSDLIVSNALPIINLIKGLCLPK